MMAQSLLPCMSEIGSENSILLYFAPKTARRLMCVVWVNGTRSRNFFCRNISRDSSGEESEIFL